MLIRILRFNYLTRLRTSQPAAASLKLTEILRPQAPFFRYGDKGVVDLRFAQLTDLQKRTLVLQWGQYRIRDLSDGYNNQDYQAVVGIPSQYL